MIGTELKLANAKSNRLAFSSNQKVKNQKQSQMQKTSKGYKNRASAVRKVKMDSDHTDVD